MLRFRTCTRSCSTAPLLHDYGYPVAKTDVQKDAPECIAGSNEDPEAILDEPEADFGQISALAHAINTDEGDTVGYTLLGRS
jgi:hypothetical protein